MSELIQGSYERWDVGDAEDIQQKKQGLSESGKQDNKWTTSFGHIGKTPKKSIAKASRAKWKRSASFKKLGKLIDCLK